MTSLVNIPHGSESFLRPFLQLVSESSPNLAPKIVQEIRNLYYNRDKDVRFLVPIVQYLSKDEVDEFITIAISSLSIETLKAATAKLLSSQNGVSATHLLYQLVIVAEVSK